MKNNNYYVYIMASESGTLYIGVTGDLKRRVCEHKNGLFDGFSKKYGCKKLVYYEYGTDIENSIAREKQLKGLLRKKKEKLIKSMNPRWEDLSEKL
jgi:putative endonuclease